MFKFLKDRIAEDLKYVDMLFTEMTRLMGLEDEHLNQRTQSAIFNQKTLNGIFGWSDRTSKLNLISALIFLTSADIFVYLFYFQNS